MKDKESDKLKIRLTIAIKYMSPKDNEERAMHSRSNNIKIMTTGKADKVIKELFESLLYRH